MIHWNARRIINGVDQADRIAEFAATIEDVLKSAIVVEDGLTFTAT